MGLFHKLKNNDYQNFNTYADNLCGREGLLACFAAYGDPTQILTELLNTPSCCLNSKLDVRVNANFMLTFYKKTLRNEPSVRLLKTDEIRYCYHSGGGFSCGYDTVGMIMADGSKSEISVSKSKLAESVAVFQQLRQYVHGFEQIPFGPGPEEVGTLRLLNYYFQEPQNLIWCEQYHNTDGDADDPYWLKLYGSNGKTTTLIFNSEEEAFRRAMQLKKCVPHLLYGPSEEYKKLFKQDPAQLMALAKKQVHK